MGEIGLDRREYLYELTQTDIVLISRGYWKRFHPGWEMTRLLAYKIHYANGVPKGETPPSVQQWLPFPWERIEAAISEDEAEELRQELLAMREAYRQEHEKKDE